MNDWRGGVHYDSDTHRSGVDWNYNGSVDVADGAFSMFAMDEAQKMEEDARTQASQNQGWGRAKSCNNSSSGTGIEGWFLRHTGTMRFVTVLCFGLAIIIFIWCAVRLVTVFS